ncbi:MAG: acyl carrier protein [Mucispirillum sp.]|nr:acyl carrier protein [Mucispirillum sp.]
MTKSEVMEKIKEILNDLFDDDFDVTESTVADDIDGWDSLAHLQVISAMESGFNIHFTLGEINNFANVGEMADSILKHLG